jgi:hypothetical protein
MLTQLAPPKPPAANPLALGFSVHPADNGGWVLDCANPEQYRHIRHTGAFTSTADLLIYLARALPQDEAPK